jgi:hypothetical protein
MLDNTNPDGEEKELINDETFPININDSEHDQSSQKNRASCSMGDKVAVSFALLTAALGGLSVLVLTDSFPYTIAAGVVGAVIGGGGSKTVEAVGRNWCGFFHDCNSTSAKSSAQEDNSSRPTNGSYREY